MTTSSLPVLRRPSAIIFLLVALLCLTSCDSPGGRIQKIRKDLDAFKSSPCDAGLAQLEESFVDIDAVIKDLEVKEDFAQADLFRRQAKTLHYEFVAIRSAYFEWRNGQQVQARDEKLAPEGSGKVGQ